MANEGHPAPLEVRKLYALLEPIARDPPSLVRVVDESGEDYLYPKSYFRAVALPRSLRRELARLAR